MFIIGRQALPGFGTTNMGIMNPIPRLDIAGHIAPFSEGFLTSNVRALAFFTSNNG